ncbi:hypothetical protein AYO21_01905 [Fonsecaea monophora]|uniref:Uncharacterized protein n=1 Tax=Fonsecaea monophora TaxID=254056 RepID=A0A177FHE8_9EURO|nr:hypothetical protein AYO21_01905 [Fonsecaea monophora]OAG43678.1 hypothetical protein AYO21_01905 [Fonsecaea monophora]
MVSPSHKSRASNEGSNHYQTCLLTNRARTLSKPERHKNMGNALSKAKHELRVPEKRARRRSSHQRGRRRSPRVSRCGSEPHPSSRGQHSTTSSSSKPYSSGGWQMSPPTVSEHRPPGTRTHYHPLARPLWRHPQSDLRGRRRRHENPRHLDEEPEIDDPNPENWPGQMMPHAPLPPNWDPRFYAGLPSESTEDVRQIPCRRPFDRRQRCERQHRRPPVRVRRSEKVYVDPRHPHWLGVRVTLVDGPHLHWRSEAEAGSRLPERLHAAASPRTHVHIRHSRATPLVRRGAHWVREY